MAKSVSITIDLDKQCKRCGESGALKSGYCLGCIADMIAAGELDHIIKPKRERRRREGS